MARDSGADAPAEPDQPAVVARLRRGHARRRPALPHPVRGRRRQPRGLACVVDTPIGGVRVVRELERLVEARATIEAWRDDYNFRSSYSSRGALTPIEFARLKTEKLIPPSCGSNQPGLYL